MKITVPTKLSDISWLDYQKYKKVVAVEGLDQAMHDLALVTIFCGLDLNESKQISVNDVTSIANRIKEVLESEAVFQQRFKYEGVEYGFIPNMDKMTAGEYIDLERYLQSEDTYPRAMAVMYRPIKSKVGNMYNIIPYEGTEATYQVMEKMNLDVTFGASVFFYNLSKELLKAIEDYLASQTIQNQVKDQSLTISMDGINQSIQLLKEISLSLMQLRNYPYTHS